MTTRQRNRVTTDNATNALPVATTDDADPTPTMQEGLGEGINILPRMDARDVIMVGHWVVYRVRAGRVIPMLVTAVHGPELIDGVAFSARPSDVGNSYGSRGHQRVKQGAGDGEWQV